MRGHQASARIGIADSTTDAVLIAMLVPATVVNLGTWLTRKLTGLLFTGRWPGAPLAGGPRQTWPAPVTAHPQAPSSAATTPAAEEGPSPAGPGPLPADIAWLAHLLHPTIQMPARQREQPRPPARDPQEGMLLGARPADRATTRGSLQEQVLADLMHDPGAAREITAWLPATAFNPGTHCGLYANVKGGR